VAVSAPMWPVAPATAIRTRAGDGNRTRIASLEGSPELVRRAGRSGETAGQPHYGLVRHYPGYPAGDRCLGHV
jgi:hypothetical protein